MYAEMSKDQGHAGPLELNNISWDDVVTTFVK